MPRDEYRSQLTTGEVTAALVSVLGEESRFIIWNRRVGRVRVNGVPLDAQQARFKRPDDVIYHTQTHEALMSADMVVALDLDDQIENITSRDKPDLVLHFKSGIAVYADFTRACIAFDEANSEAIRAANRSLRIRLADAPPADWRGRPFAPRFTLRLRPTQRIREDALLAEIFAYIDAFDGRFGNVDSLGNEHPILSGLGATSWWSHSKFEKSDNVISTMFKSRDLASLVEAIKDRIADKTERYQDRPLWLFISISESWADYMGDGSCREFLKAAGTGALTFDLHEFERVVVGVTGQSVFLKPRM